jgi:hypothetical protein
MFTQTTRDAILPIVANKSKEEENKTGESNQKRKAARN